MISIPEIERASFGIKIPTKCSCSNNGNLFETLQTSVVGYNPWTYASRMLIISTINKYVYGTGLRPCLGRRKIEVGSFHQRNRFALLIYFASILVNYFFFNAFVPLTDSEFVHCGVKEGNRVDIKNLISVQQGHLVSVKPSPSRSIPNRSFKVHITSKCIQQI